MPRSRNDKARGPRLSASTPYAGERPWIASLASLAIRALRSPKAPGTTTPDLAGRAGSCLTSVVAVHKEATWISTASSSIPRTRRSPADYYTRLFGEPAFTFEGYTGWQLGSGVVTRRSPFRGQGARARTRAG